MMNFDFKAEAAEILQCVFNIKPLDLKEAASILSESGAGVEVSRILNDHQEAGGDIIGCDVVALVLEHLTCNAVAELEEVCGDYIEFNNNYNFLDWSISLCDESREHLEALFSDDVGLWENLSEPTKFILDYAGVAPCELAE